MNNSPGIRYLDWERPVRSSSTTVIPTLLSPSLNHALIHHIYTSEHLQGCWLQHHLGQSLPVLDIGTMSSPSDKKSQSVSPDKQEGRTADSRYGEGQDTSESSLSQSSLAVKFLSSPRSCAWDLGERGHSHCKHRAGSRPLDETEKSQVCGAWWHHPRIIRKLADVVARSLSITGKVMAVTRLQEGRRKTSLLRERKIQGITDLWASALCLPSSKWTLLSNLVSSANWVRVQSNPLSWLYY